jgi:hypothetical protein
MVRFNIEVDIIAHFTDEETEIPRDEFTGLKSHG